MVNEPDVLYQIYQSGKQLQPLLLLKEVSGLPDRKLADFLNVSEKSLRTYRNEPSKISIQLKEHVLLLGYLYELGHQLFTTDGGFDQWLATPNFFFDDQAPEYYLNTINGIRYVYNRLLAMQHGDNV